VKLRILLTILALAWAAVLPLRAGQAAPDWAAVAGAYPAAGTLRAQEEAAILLWLQGARTRADVGRVQAEGHPDLALFLGAIGSSCASAYPATRDLLRRAREDLKPVVAGLKARFARPRPHVTDPALTPALPDDDTCSFPSKHAALGALYAALLARLDPADQAALAEEGRLIGDDRALAGLHWPSDVEAGQRVGAAFAAYWAGLPENGGLVQDAASEWGCRR
jgi:membrane-associated phospholipid phosphatase